jgi:hypothetical protein
MGVQRSWESWEQGDKEDISNLEGGSDDRIEKIE